MRDFVEHISDARTMPPEEVQELIRKAADEAEDLVEQIEATIDEVVD